MIPPEGVAFMPAHFTADMSEDRVMTVQAEPPSWTLESVAALLRCKPHEVEWWKADGWVLQVKLRPPEPAAIVRFP